MKNKKDFNSLKFLESIDFNQQFNDIQEENKNKNRKMLLSILQVIDSFDRCFSSINHSQEISSESQQWLSSFDKVREQLIKVMENNNVVFMDCLNQPFDPNNQKAFEIKRSNELSDYVVIEVINRGCEWNGEILRMATVVVEGPNED